MSGSEQNWLEHWVDDVILPSSVSGGIFRLLLIAGVCDLAYLNGRFSSFAIRTAEMYTGTISLIFSGALVLLYFEQQRSQRRQTDLIERQVDIQESQAEIERERFGPDINVQNISIWEREGADLRSYQSEFITGLVLDNRGRGKADNLELDYMIYFLLSDYRAYVSTVPLGIRAWSGQPVEISEQELENEIPVDFEGRNRLSSNDEKEYVCTNVISYTPHTGPAQQQKKPVEGCILL